MKFLSFLLLLAVNLSLSLAQYSFVPKQFVDSDWYLMKSTWFDTNFATARSICSSYNLALADIRSSADYDYLANLFCPANSWVQFFLFSSILSLLFLNSFLFRNIKTPIVSVLDRPGVERSAGHL